MTDCVTISLLPVSLSLVHIPRSRQASFHTEILRQILQPDPIFLNVTCNEIEISIFAEHHALKDFLPIARKDALKPKLRINKTLPDRVKTRPHPRDTWGPVEVSSERWNVLQIESHSDQLDTSGARVHELSAPLAAAGISIFYHSSYMSDFIFVKETRLSEVMSLLGAAGFDLYSTDLQNLTSQLSAISSPILSPLLSSTLASDDVSSLHLEEYGNSSQGHGFSSENGAVLTRSRSSTNSGRSPVLLAQRWDSNNTPDKDALQVPSRTHSHSPSACDVRVLEPDLTCVGLTNDASEAWGLKIVKLIAFPELITGTGGPDSAYEHYSPSSSSSGNSDVACHDAVAALRLEDLCVGNDSDATTHVGPYSPKGPSLTPSYELQSPDDDPDDENNESDSDSSDVESYYSAGLADSPRTHLADLLTTDTEPVPAQRQHRPQLSQLDTATPHTSCKAIPGTRSRSSSASSTAPSPPAVPFFSFTRTLEGSSLAAPVSLLAALFPASERHMVICSDELDILDSREGSPGSQGGMEEDSYEVVEDDYGMRTQGPLRCLQIDLRKFGLDKHGLVNRFSRTLEENGINHMYSSTYKTANLLVDKAHARRAQALLRAC